MAPRPSSSASTPRSPATCPPSASASRTPPTSPSSRPTPRSTSKASPSRSRRSTTRPSRPADSRTPQVRRQQEGPRHRRPAELVRRRVHAEGPGRRQARPGLPGEHLALLTQGQDWNGGTKARPFASYFRTATTDAVQGPFAAQYLFNDAKKKNVFVIDDKKTYGAGLAGTFKAEFEKLGGKIAGTEHIDPETKDFSSVATKVKSSGADVVYYGGEYPTRAGPLSKQIKKAGAKIPLVGGDGIYSGEYIKLSGAEGVGDLATSVGAPIETLPSAKEFVANYEKAGYKEPFELYGGYSYDAAWSIIEAVKAVVEANDGKLPSDARAKVAEAVGKVDFEGVTGKVSFDEFGDTTNKQLTVYEYKDGNWAAVKSGELTS
ncbi:hypothetical protein SMICM17S_03433 [Streptomyces microflavus]